MNTSLNIFLLLSALTLPLLLALPKVRSHLPWPCHIALLPTVFLLIISKDFSLELPWLLFGTGLGIDETSRLLLIMTVVLWAVAARFLQSASDSTRDDRRITFFMLTLTGNLGAILTTDLIGFFTFSTLMGYGFYGLLVSGQNKLSHQAGRTYLIILILADIALFEALLIAAATTNDLSFNTLHQAMPPSTLYLSMVLIGFAAKAGIWPLHFWLTRLVASTPSTLVMLLGGVPIAIALLGLLRWLPVGEIISPNLGLFIQGLGIAAMFYAILIGIKRTHLKMLPAYVAIFATGLFTAALGTGLSEPDFWNRYSHWAYFFIVALGSGLAILSLSISWLQAKPSYSATATKPIDDSSLWFIRWLAAVINWGAQMGIATLPRWRAALLAKVNHLKQLHWQTTLKAQESYLLRWSNAIILFLLLGIVIIFFIALS